jgi:hypothetical protein
VLDLRKSNPWLNLFKSCYAVRAHDGTAWFERVALPVEGGIAQQPAKDMQALDHLETLANEILRERLKEIRDKKKSDG